MAPKVAKLWLNWICTKEINLGLIGISNLNIYWNHFYMWKYLLHLPCEWDKIGEAHTTRCKSPLPLYDWAVGSWQQVCKPLFTAFHPPPGTFEWSHNLAVLPSLQCAFENYDLWRLWPSKLPTATTNWAVDDRRSQIQKNRIICLLSSAFLLNAVAAINQKEKNWHECSKYEQVGCGWCM